MKKVISLILAVAMIASLSVVASFAATEKLDISYDTLREVNDAVGKEGADAAAGPSYANVGDWHWEDGQVGVQGKNDYLLPFETFTASETEDAIVIMNYNNYIRISKDIDLGKYTSMTITYSIGATPATVEGNEIGLFSDPVAYGQAGTKTNTDKLIASAALENYEAHNWNVSSTVEIDLSEIDYKGELYISYYMEQGHGVCISAIELTLADSGDAGDTGNEPQQPDNTETADSTAVMFMIAAAAVVATVLLKKRAF